MLPKITFKETGWRKTLAIYRKIADTQAFGMSNKIVLEKFGINDCSNAMKPVIAAKDVVDRYADLSDLYRQGELIERFCNNDRDVWRMITILSSYGITDIAKYTHSFNKLKGIGPKYADILTKARDAAKFDVKHLVDLHIRVDSGLRDKYKEMAKVNNKTVSEVIADILQEYIKKVG